MSDLVAEAITEAFGERCPDFEPECHCCKAWAEFDRITTLEAENTALRQIVHETASALPNGAFIAPSCSVEFMAGLPNEVKSVCATLEAELQKAREAALEEAAKVAEGLAPFSQDSIASASSSALLDNEASVTRSIFARRVAAAIRALSQDKEARE